MNLTVLWNLLITGILRGGLYALMAGGLALLFGVMNICNFAHGELFVVGAYVAYFAYVTFGLPPLLAILIAAGASFLLGALLEKSLILPLRRRSKGEWIMNTFLLTSGLSVVMQNTAQRVWGVRYRGITQYWAGTIRITPTMSVAVDRAVAFLIAVVGITGFWLFMRRTNIGRAIRAVSQNETGAMLVGIDLDNIQTLTFALGSMLAGLGGASMLSLIPAYPFAGGKPNITSWFVVTVVGLGNVSGSIVGGFIVGLVESFAFFYLGSGWQDVFSLGVIILILLVKPSGLFGSEVKGVLER
jgi:branched-chain amino acid transport system permease protein